MAFAGLSTQPAKSAYDVVIVGGAMMGASTAWFLSDNPDFTGSVLVVERDPTYQNSATGHTNSCIRQQFSSALNVRISQFGANFIQNLRAHMGGDDRVPHLKIQNYGYMYLADTQAFAATLKAAQEVPPRRAWRITTDRRGCDAPCMQPRSDLQRVIDRVGEEQVAAFGTGSDNIDQHLVALFVAGQLTIPLVQQILELDSADIAARTKQAIYQRVWWQNS